MAAPSTLKEIRDKIRVDLDLQEETFIENAEINSYINDGIREAEAEIATIGPEIHNYFLSRFEFGLTTGKQEYKLPSDIYIHKIRAIIYDDNGINTHKIKPIKDFHQIPYIIEVGTSQYYRYVMTQEKKGPRIQLYPTPNLDNIGAVTIWYIRNAKQLETDTDETDIPEFVNFLIEYAKVKCLQKEGHPLVGQAEAQLAQERKLMVDTLTARTVDDENFIPLDMQHYQEMF